VYFGGATIDVKKGWLSRGVELVSWRLQSTLPIFNEQCFRHYFSSSATVEALLVFAPLSACLIFSRTPAAYLFRVLRFKTAQTTRPCF